MTTLKTPSALRTIFRVILSLSFFTFLACGYHFGTGPERSDGAESTGAGRNIAIPLFENTTFEPILEKRVTEAFKETFFSKGWKVVSDQRHASLILTGRILRFERIPISLRQDGLAEEFRVKIGMEVRLLDSEKEPTQEGKAAPLKREAEGIADYIARADVAADRVAEDRAIREAGRKMAEQVADLLPTKNFFKSEPKAETRSQQTLPAKE
jgi:hypothetical protein